MKLLYFLSLIIYNNLFQEKIQLRKMEPAPPKRNDKYPAFYKGLPVSSTWVNPNLREQFVVVNGDTVNRFSCPARILVAGPSGK